MATTATAAAAKTRKRGVAAELLAREQQPKSKAKKEGVSSHVAAGQERPARLLYFTGMLHPFGAEEQCVRVSRGVHQVAEVFVPASMYAGTNPMYFLPHHGPSDVRDMFRRIFNVFGYLACSASQSTKQPKASDGSGVREVEYVPSPYTMHVTWEVVRSAKKRSLVVGYRLRLLEATIEAGSPGMAHRLAYDLIARNNDTAFKTMARLPGGRAPPSSSRFSAPAEPCSPFSVTTQAWNDLCRYYGGTSFAKETREQTSTQTGDKDSPFYLTNIFSLERSRELARNAGADPAYCSHAAYEGSGHDLCPYLYTWPHTEDVYGLLPSHLDPTSLSERTSPTRRPNMKQYTEARREYERLHGPGSGTLFDQLGVQTSDSTAAVDIHSLTLEAKRARKESELAAPGKPALQHALWRERQLELNRVMSDVLHPAGDCAPALQHIAAWGIGYLEENAHSFQCERTQSSSNLTAFGDFWAQQLDLLNTVANVISSHRMVVRMLLSAFGVFRRKNDNVHGLELGPPEAGKSFAMNTMTKMLIEKSWVNVADMTNRAMTGPGKANDSLVVVIEDAPASLLGVQSANKTKSGVSGDKENMIKNFLTQIQTSLLSVTMEPKRTSELVQADTCCVTLMAMNEPTNVFSDAILSRFHVTQWTAQPQSDMAPSMASVHARGSNPAVIAAQSAFCTNWRRVHHLVAQVTYRIAANIILDVTMDAATTFFSLVASHAAKKYGLAMQQRRNFSRFSAILTPVCVVQAGSVVWDTPLCPFAGVPHDDEHYLAPEKHLVATIEQAVFVIGLLSAQWQDTLSNDIVRALKKHYFPQAERRIEARKRVVRVQSIDSHESLDDDADGMDDFAVPPPVEPIMPCGFFAALQRGRPGGAAAAGSRDQVATPQQVSEYQQKRAEYDAFREARKEWWYDTLVLGGPLCSRPTKPNASAHDVLEHLADQLMRHLAPQPMRSEVVATLMRLTKQLDDATRRVRPLDDGECTQTVSQQPALKVTQDAIKVSLVALERAEHSDALSRAVHEVLGALMAVGAVKPHDGSDTLTYVYGETEPDAPSVWKMVRVKATPVHEVDHTMLRVLSADFYPEDQQTLTRDFIRTMEAGEAGGDEYMTRLFPAQTPWTRIDGDLNANAVERRTTDLGLHPSVQDQTPSNRAEVTETLLRRLAAQKRARERQPDMVYPHSVLAGRRNREWQTQWEANETRATQSFSLAARTEASRLRRQTSLDPNVPVPASYRVSPVDITMADDDNEEAREAAANEARFAADLEADEMMDF